MQTPAGIPWNPRDLLAPDQPQPGLSAAIVGWEVMIQVFAQRLPQAWDELLNLLGA
jgi:hypothetical protein